MAVSKEHQYNALEHLDIAVALCNRESYMLEWANQTFWRWLKHKEEKVPLKTLFPQIDELKLEVRLERSNHFSHRCEFLSKIGSKFPVEFIFRNMKEVAQKYIVIQGFNRSRVIEKDYMVNTYAQLLEEHNQRNLVQLHEAQNYIKQLEQMIHQAGIVYCILNKKGLIQMQNVFSEACIGKSVSELLHWSKDETATFDLIIQELMNEQDGSYRHRRLSKRMNTQDSILPGIDIYYNSGLVTLIFKDLE